MAEAKASKGNRKYRTYTPQEVVKAIAEYIATGCLREASRVTGIPTRNIERWTRKYPELAKNASQKMQETAKQAGEDIATQFVNLRKHCIEQSYKLDFGNALDSIKGAAIITEKLQLISGLPTERTELSAEHRHNLPNIEDQNSVGEFAKRFLAGSNGNGSSGNGNGNGRKLADPVPGINRTSEHAGE